ncbi:acyl-CoA N-acyltransferase [Zychaea mexicana]|uniref:acyl-CoA N-acyltransferase n=1 Tax=Zychaea mexicana TaxID=64656 RepID=UPI0022FE08D0|nr:acyl-CoA N-acyltransferase [Zychaea mexicana]KAI9496942.1 acyl-CoA N-acyltransferase [Zychaea mexicana]
MAAFRIECATNHNFDTKQFKQLVVLFQELSSAATEETVRGALDSPQNRVLVAILNDDAAPTPSSIAGALTVAMTPCASGIRVHIEDVVVSTRWRRQGIATLLLKEAIQRATHEFHARTIDLTSRPVRDAANNLYRKLGFVQRETNVYRYELEHKQ